MAPFEALYGSPCRSPLCSAVVGDSSMLGPNIVAKTTDKIKLIKAWMKTAQDLQKSYVDRRRRDLEFWVGDHVFLHIMLMKGIRRFGVSSKLSPRYMGSFEILERVWSLAYRLALPPQLSLVHDIFHVSMLRKCIAHPRQVIDYHPLQVKENASYIESSICIVDKKEKVLRNRSIPYLKIQSRRSNLGAGRRNEALVSPPFRVIKHEFGGPNSFKGGKDL